MQVIMLPTRPTTNMIEYSRVIVTSTLRGSRYCISSAVTESAGGMAPVDPKGSDMIKDEATSSAILW